jgi:hypothetical protein
MPDYDKGKIYKIVSPNSDKIYIGSTVQPLKDRFDSHMSNWRNGQNRHSTTAFRIIDKGGAFIQLIEDFACKTKWELNRREGEFIREHNCVNKLVPRPAAKEYYASIRDKELERKRIYRENNRELINQRAREKKSSNDVIKGIAL